MRAYAPWSVHSSVNWVRVAVDSIGDVRTAARIAGVRVATLQRWIGYGYCRYRDPAIALAAATGYPAVRLMGFAIRLPLGWHPRRFGASRNFVAARTSARTCHAVVRPARRRVGIISVVPQPPDDDGGCRPHYRVAAPVRTIVAVAAAA